jgi:hypothetical protein
LRFSAVGPLANGLNYRRRGGGRPNR